MLNTIEVKLVLPLLQAVEALVLSSGVEEPQATRVRLLALDKLAQSLRKRIAK